MNDTHDRLHQAILESVSETFEAMIFTMVSPVDYDFVDEKPKDTHMRASIKVENPVRGNLHLQIPENLAVKITRHFLGLMEDKKPSEIIVRDALSEIINTIVGRIMAKLLPEDQTFKLGLPEKHEGLMDLNGSENVYRFIIEDQPQSFSIIAEGDFLVQ